MFIVIEGINPMYPQSSLPSYSVPSALCSLSPVFPQPYLPSALLPFLSVVCALSPIFLQRSVP